MIPTHPQPSTSKRKTPEDTNPLQPTTKKAQKDVSTLLEYLISQTLTSNHRGLHNLVQPPNENVRVNASNIAFST